MNLAGIPLSPFIASCRAVFFEKRQQKKRMCFSVTKNTAAQRLLGRVNVNKIVRIEKSRKREESGMACKKACQVAFC